MVAIKICIYHTYIFLLTFTMFGSDKLSNESNVSNELYYADIDPIIVYNGIQYILDSSLVVYQQLIHSNEANWIVNNQHKMRLFEVEIPSHLKTSLYKDLNTSARYIARWIIKLDKIDYNHPLDSMEIFIHSLHQKIRDLNILNPYIQMQEVEIWLERGCFRKVIPEYWHRDGSAFKYALLISYGTLENWNTSVISSEIADKYFNEGIIPNIKDLDPEVVAEMESHAITSKFGHFINVLKTIHRAPKIEIMSKMKLTPNDYRITMRFVVRNHPNDVVADHDRRKANFKQKH